MYLLGFSACQPAAPAPAAAPAVALAVAFAVVFAGVGEGAEAMGPGEGGAGELLEATGEPAAPPSALPEAPPGATGPLPVPHQRIHGRPRDAASPGAAPLPGPSGSDVAGPGCAAGSSTAAPAGGGVGASGSEEVFSAGAALVRLAVEAGAI